MLGIHAKSWRSTTESGKLSPLQEGLALARKCNDMKTRRILQALTEKSCGMESAHSGS